MSTKRWIWSSEQRIPSDAAEANRVIDEILERLDAHHWTAHDIFSVHLAMEEALVNAIKHGNRCDADKQIHVVCKLSPSEIRIEIADEGRGFNLNQVPDPTIEENLQRPCGRGIMLIRNFMSRVEYNAVGNRVVMEKRRA